MARVPLLQLSGISLNFGGDPVFDRLNLVIQQGDRVALVGRNGSGKSTLLKIMAALIEQDKGSVVISSKASVGYMEQEPTMEGFATLGDFAVSGLEDCELYRVERAVEGLQFDPTRAVNKASGGERRRAALAKLMAEAPDLMLLDEPTNHLDIKAIAWLESELKTTMASYVLISHDRAFLRKLTQATIWIDRGQVKRNEKGFRDFESWRDKIWDEENMQRRKMDLRLRSEERWAAEGITARRKRNQGRLRALRDLRTKRAEMIREEGTAALAFSSGPKSGQKVIEAHNINKKYGSEKIIERFSISIRRGDRVAFVGRNGVGKTSLLKVLTGKEAPDSGQVKMGTNLTLAIFDQALEQLDLNATLWECLTSEPEMRVSGRVDQILVRGIPKHVVGYLKEFLFQDFQARAPVRSLSGGEKARLLLAKLMAKESNLLVLDEPTNNLDVETLDLMQELLADYDGTVLLVSHDRDFLDRIATTTVVMEGNGQAHIHHGGWSDFESQKPSVERVGKRFNKKFKSYQKDFDNKIQRGLSFTQKHRLKELPNLIDKLEAEIRKLEDYLHDPELFQREPMNFEKATNALVDRQRCLKEYEEEWLILEEKA